MSLISSKQMRFQVQSTVSVKFGSVSCKVYFDAEYLAQKSPGIYSIEEELGEVVCLGSGDLYSAVYCYHLC